MKLFLTRERLTVCQLPADAPIPDWAASTKSFVSITRTRTELSIVCAEELAPPAVRQERGRRAFRVDGPLDFALTGVLASVLDPLAKADFSIFALSTFDTDYVLGRADKVEAAGAALHAAGHEVRPE